MVRDGEGWNFRTEEWGAWGAHDLSWYLILYLIWGTWGTYIKSTSFWGTWNMISFHPTPYSMLLAPCSLLLAPYSLLLTPYSLLLAPYSLLPLWPDITRGTVASIHKRPIFWSLATNLGTTFKAPTNLGALASGLFSLLLAISPKSHKKLLKIIAPYFFLQNAIHLTILTPIRSDWNGLERIEMVWNVLKRIKHLYKDSFLEQFSESWTLS